MKRLFSLLLISMTIFLVIGCTSQASVTNIQPNTYVTDFQETGAAHILVDVRTPAEYAEGYIAGSVNIPLQELESRLSEIPQDVPVVVYCRSGNRSAQAASILKGKGYSDIRDLGGIIQWQSAGYSLTQEG